MERVYFRKGFKILEESIQKLGSLNDEIMYIALGKNPKDQNLKNISFLGHISDESELATIYNASNAFILPSIEDNLPNTMVESLMCGTPVIGFKTGGIGDILSDDKLGILAKSKNAEGLGNAIKEYINKSNHFNKDEIGKIAKSKFAKETVAAEYIQLYKNILGE